MCASELSFLFFITYLPTIFAGIFFGYFVISESRKSRVMLSLGSMIVIFALWASLNFFTWFPVKFSVYIWLQKLSLLYVLIFPFFVYFAYYLTEFRIKTYVHLLIHLPIFPVIILPFTKYSYLIYTAALGAKNVCALVPGPFFRYLLFLDIIYPIWIIAIIITRYRRPGMTKVEKHRYHFVMLAVLAFFTFVDAFQETRHAGASNLIVFLPVGMLFFIAILVYTIRKYRLFDIRLIAAKFFVLVIWFLLALQFSLAGFGPGSGYTHRGFTLTFAIFFGIILIRNTQRDVTRREELEEISDQLKIVNQELKIIDKEKSDFINIASHRLRTPLTSIKGYISLLLEGVYGKLSLEQAGVLKKVFATSDRLAWAIEDILNVSQIETGKMKFTFKEYSLETLVQNIVDIFSIRAQEKNLFLKYEKPKSSLPKLYIDGPKIQEVVSNLIDNAIKYTKAGGITIAIENLGGIIRLTVSDTGIGLKKEEISQIFSRFTRGRDVTRLTTEGVGLGLYVGKSMVEANGGKIWVKSEGVGKGSQFAIELPIEQRKSLLKK